MVFLFERKS
jgi:hypothetical protein